MFMKEEKESFCRAEIELEKKGEVDEKKKG